MTLKQYIVAGVIEQVIMLGFILPAKGKRDMEAANAKSEEGGGGGGGCG